MTALIDWPAEAERARRARDARRERVMGPLRESIELGARVRVPLKGE